MRTLLLFSALLLLAPTVQAQSDADAFRFSNTLPAPGGRLMGMAGASAAGVADWGTVFTNPAGLGWMQTSVFAGGLGLFSIKDEADYRIGGFAQSSEATENYANLSNISYAYRFPTTRGSLVIGAGFNQRSTFGRQLTFSGDNRVSSITESFLPYDFDIEVEAGPDDVLGTADDEYFPSFPVGSLALLAYNTFAIDLDVDAYESGAAQPFFTMPLPGTTLRQQGNVFEEGGLNEISLAGAVEAAPGVMIGGAVNFSVGSYFFDRRFTETDINDENTGSGGTADFDQLTLSQTLESRLSGVSFRAGVSAAVLPMLRVGAGIESPTWLSVNEDFDQRLTTWFDNGDDFEDSDLSTFTYSVRSPWKLNAGVAFSLANFHAALDAEYVDWSSMRLGTDEFIFGDLFTDTNAAIRQDYNGVLNTRIGFELTLGPAAIRAGYAFQPDPVEGGDRSREFFSSGFSFRTGNLEFVLDAMQQQFKDQYVPYLASEPAGDPIVQEEVTRNKVTLGVRIKL